MEIDVVMPQLGTEIDEAQIDSWLKKIGDHVKAGETLLSVTTPKATIEIEAPVSGILSKVMFEADDLANVGATLGIITSA